MSADDLDAYFGEHMTGLTAYEDFLQYENLRDEILAWYDGYSWDGETRVLNPFSLLSLFMHKRFSCFWYASGSPKFLIDLLGKKPESYVNLKRLAITELMLDSIELEKLSIEPLLFQTGYLTIKEVMWTKGAPVYLLEMPNNEVREAFNLQLIASFTENGQVRAGQARMEIGAALLSNDLHRMTDLLRSLFASIPYELHIDREAYYHSIFYAVMTVLGFDMDVELSVSKGRVDAVLELGDMVYVMEFKYKDCKPGENEATKHIAFEAALDEGMAQIKDRGYHIKYMASGKAIILAVFAFLGRDDIEMRSETLTYNSY
jgi:hypothetical protein